MRIRAIALLSFAGILLTGCFDPRVRAERMVLDQVGIPRTYQFINQHQEQDLAIRQYLSPPKLADVASLQIPASFTPFTPQNSLDNYIKATGWKPLAEWLAPDSRDSNQTCLITFEITVDFSKTFSPGLSKSDRSAVKADRLALVRLGAGCD